MPFRFRRTIRVAPGLSINLGKKSASLRVGGRGAGYTISTNGNRTTTVGLPGTGISWTKTIRPARVSGAPAPQQPPIRASSPSLAFWQRSWVIVACIIFLPPIGLALTWVFAPWSATTRYVAMAIAALLTARLVMSAIGS